MYKRQKVIFKPIGDILMALIPKPNREVLKKWSGKTMHTQIACIFFYFIHQTSTDVSGCLHNNYQDLKQILVTKFMKKDKLNVCNFPFNLSLLFAAQNGYTIST
jgi:hypothetical protein